MKKIFLGLLLLLASGCTTSPVVLNSNFDSKLKPVYEDYFNYYLFGFVGKATVNLQKVCVDQKPYALQRTFTFDDGLITLVTLGIYTPMTVRVWCGD